MLLAASSFAPLWTEFVEVLTTVVSGVPTAFKSGFMEFLYEDPTASTLVISDFAKFGFGVAAFSVASALAIGICKRFLHGRIR